MNKIIYDLAIENIQNKINTNRKDLISAEWEIELNREFLKRSKNFDKDFKIKFNNELFKSIRNIQEEIIPKLNKEYIELMDLKNLIHKEM